MMKKMLKNVLIMSGLMLVSISLNEAYATENVEETENKEANDSEILGADTIPSEKQSADRGITFDTIYDVEEPETEDTNSQNVLSPAEPKDEMIEEITNKDKNVEETIEKETSEEPDAPSEDLEENAELEDADDLDKNKKEKVEDNDAQQPIYDNRGKITEEGLTYLDETVNDVMSKKIVKSPPQKEKNVQKHSKDKRSETFIRDRMTNFLSFHSLNDKTEKTFVRNLFVESIIVKYTSATKLPL